MENLRNLRQEEETALRSLKNIIEPADKDGQIGVWLTKSYIVEAYN